MPKPRQSRQRQDDDRFSPDVVGWQNVTAWDQDRGTYLIQGTINFTRDFLEELLAAFEDGDERVIGYQSQDDQFDRIQVAFGLKDPIGNSDYSGGVWPKQSQQNRRTRNERGSGRRTRNERGSGRNRDDDDPKKDTRGTRQSSVRDSREDTRRGNGQAGTSRHDPQARRRTENQMESGSSSRQRTNGFGGTSRSSAPGKSQTQRSSRSAQSPTQSERRTRPPRQ